MARIDQKIGRWGKKAYQSAKDFASDTFSQQQVNPYDPNAANYHAFGDPNYAQGQAQANQGQGECCAGAGCRRPHAEH
jgi:hypothetical protein